MNLNIDELIRSKRRTVSLEVTRDGRLVVRAPLRMPIKLIERAVAGKSEWIQNKKQSAAARDSLHPPKQCVEGEQFELLGKSYTLKFDAGVQKITLSSDALLVPAAYMQCREQLPQALTAWYKAQAADILRSRVAAFAGQHAIAYESVRVTSALSRWGSCSGKGRLCFSWRLALAPPEMIDYVIAHELAHIDRPDHSAAFWRHVAALMPDFSARREWFRQQGALLRRDFFAQDGTP